MASPTDLAAWMPGEDDAALVARAWHGDEAALTRLYERHTTAVLAHLRRLTGDREEAEGVLQDTLLPVVPGDEDRGEMLRTRARELADHPGSSHASILTLPVLRPSAGLAKHHAGAG